MRERAVSFWNGHRESLIRFGRHGALIGAFVIIVLLVHRELYSFLGSQDSYVVDPAGRGMVVQPEWAPQAGGDSTGPVTDNLPPLLDDDALRKIHAAFDRNPWIRGVKSVERVYPSKIRVRFEYREPHLAIRTNSGYVLLDNERVRLPGLYPEPIRGARDGVIQGVKSAPPQPGRMWDAAGVRKGSELVDLCNAWPTLRVLGIQAVDVSNRTGVVKLISENGCAIHWGRAPSLAGPRELKVQDKIRNLRRVLARYPRLEGLESVRVYVDPVIRRRDMTNAKGQDR